MVYEGRLANPPPQGRLDYDAGLRLDSLCRVKGGLVDSLEKCVTCAACMASGRQRAGSPGDELSTQMKLGEDVRSAAFFSP